MALDLEFLETCNNLESLTDQSFLPLESENHEARIPDFLNEKTLEKIQKALFNDHRRGLVAHQIQSFDRFMSRDIERLFVCTPALDVLPGYTATTAPSKEASPSSHIWKRAEVVFQKVSISKPQWASKEGAGKPLYPNEARLRKMTYSAAVSADIHLKVYKPWDATGKGKQKLDGKVKNAYEVVGQDQLFKNVLIGQIPVMVNSSFCRLSGLDKQALIQKRQCTFDAGGFFIVKGSEKVLISQEVQRRGFWCYGLKNGKGYYVKFSLLNDGLLQRFSYVSVSLKCTQSKKDSDPPGLPILAVKFLYVNTEIDVVILLRALGITNDRDLMDIIGVDANDTQMVNLIIPSIEAANLKMASTILDAKSLDSSLRAACLQDDALQLLGKIFKKSSRNPEETPSKTLEHILFPHLADKSIKKALLLGYMVKCVMECWLHRRKEEDKNDLKNKRLELAGDLFLEQFRVAFLKIRKELGKSLQKVLVKDGSIDLHKLIDPSHLTRSFENAFQTGNWARPPDRKDLKSGGIVVPLDRKNPLVTLSHLRQTELKVDLRAKLWDTRCPKKSHIGRFCLVQTPDGEKCGLVKSLAISSHVSLGSPEEEILNILRVCCIAEPENTPLHSLRNLARIFLNGHLVMVHDQPKDLTRHLKLLRRTSKIPSEVEICEDAAKNEVRIFSDSGRILRPLLVINNSMHSEENQQELKEGMTQAKFLEAGIVEFLGPEEEAGCLVAADINEIKRNGSLNKFSHCELHPSFMFGVGASLIPFANHNHTSRVMHQCQKHGKQAIGFYTTYLHSRVDTGGQELFYPQKPLVNTRVGCLLNRNELFNGQSAIVAVCPFLGFNQEDSIVMNQSSIDRGLFNSLHYRGFVESINQEVERLMKPAISDSRKVNKLASAYDKLDNDGLPFIGANLSQNDIVFGKTTIEQSNALYEDTSVALKACEKGRVDRVVLAVDGDEKMIARVILRERRKPIVGDKFSSMHGQKGVVGLTVAEDDLPFTKSGVVPEILINPHAFPSRQTVGQLLETHLGKVAALKGEICDGTSYSHKPIEAIVKELHGLGFEAWGKESMIHGQTGQMMEASIFIGPAFYQRLTRMAEDQVKFRRKGPKHPLTRQPVADRKRHGGVRIGEMERDCLLAHGASANIQERLFYLADCYQVYICQACKTMATKDTRSPSRTCRFCKSGKNIVRVAMPYSCKLLFQELLSMGVHMRFHAELD